METSLQNLLIEGINKIDSSLVKDEIIGKLSCLYDQITLFNPSYGLVNASGEELIVKHILDCLSPQPIIKSFIQDDSSIADLGSGSGLPGLVLASVFPNNNFTLVERMGRRCQFLNNTVVLMGLKDKVKIVQSDLEKVNDKFDLVTFRAFRPIKEIIKDLDRITYCNSVICTYKSSQENLEEEILAVDNYNPNLFNISQQDYQVPFLDAKRVLLSLKKLAQ